MRGNDIRIIAITFITMLILSIVPVYAANVSGFSDVDEGDWYADHVQYCYENDLMKGTSTTTFEPNTKMSRAMLVTVLYRVAGSPAISGANPFKDLAAGSWYYNAVIWAYENGIVKGTSATAFSPDDDISREAMVTIFYRYAQSESYDVSNRIALTSYTDVASVSAWAKEAMQWAVADGMIKGSSATTLNPEGATTRAECATVIRRFDVWANEEKNEDEGPAAHEHSYAVVKEVAATCKEQGYKIYQCECGDSYNGDKTAVKSHNYILDLYAEATCGKDGFNTYKCKICGDFYTDTVTATGNHSYELIQTVDATCKTAGKKIYECSVCGDETEEQTAPATNNHVWEYTHEDEVGHYANTILVCRCGWSCKSEGLADANISAVILLWGKQHTAYYTSIGAVNDHSYSWLQGDWVVDTPAVDLWTCSECGETTTDHTTLEGHTVRRKSFGSPDCHTPSHDTYACADCGYTYKTNFQECLGHDWNDWVITEAVSDESRGWATRSCAECGYTMGDYADLVSEHYCSYKPETGHVCVECGKDDIE